jgi:hypothetical protein
MSRRLILYTVALGFIYALVCSSPSRAQSSSSLTAEGTKANSVLLTRLSPPVYPPIALTARISGDIDLVLSIRRDGGVDSAVATSGPPLLYQAALNSAKQTQFKCDNCTAELTQYHLFYSFRIDVPPDPCTGPNACYTPPSVERPSEVTQVENHITLMARPSPVCICDYVRKVRSLKCFYLWRCGYGKL